MEAVIPTAMNPTAARLPSLFRKRLLAIQKDQTSTSIVQKPLKTLLTPVRRSKTPTPTTLSGTSPGRPSSPPLRRSGSSTTESSSRKKAFRLQGNHLFLTYPQCKLTKEEAEKNLKLKFPTQLEKYLVARESHKDGEPHLHIYLHLREKYRSAREGDLDSIGGQHGNYQTAKNPTKVIKYLIKEGDYLSSLGFNPAELVKLKEKKKGSVSTSVARSLMEGQTLDQVLESQPGFFLLQKRKIEEFLVYLQLRKEAEALVPWSLPAPSLTSSIEDQMICDWLALNIKTIRGPAQEHLYLYGATSLGKTSLIAKLRTMLRVYDIPPGEDFYDFYEDGKYDLAVLDEFKANKTIQWLNSWLQGHTMILRVKGAQKVKKDNLPTIIVSNYSPEECYTKTNKISTLLRRVTIVNVKTPINLYN